MKSYQGYFSLKEDDDNDQPAFNNYRATLRNSIVSCGCIAIFLIYTALLLWLVPYLVSHQTSAIDTASKYAELEAGSMTSFPWTHYSPYTNENHTLAMEAWQNIKTDTGIIAMDDSFADEKGLQRGWRFPWDNSKGLYVILGYHNLHCTRFIYLALMEFKHGKPQTYHFDHILHCIDSLRRDTLCNADDTPLPITNEGITQQRQCRDWGQLEAWANENNACYRRVYEVSPPDEDMLARFRFCPPGSPYRKEAERVFGPMVDAELL